MEEPDNRCHNDGNDQILTAGIPGGQDAGYTPFGRDRSGSVADALV